MRKTEKWSPHQNGFMEEKRTEDNIFILNSAFHKYVKARKEKLYVAFIDFKNFFDTINRNLLFYKLIKDMYHNSKYCIKTSKGITESIISNTGVLQGYNLSPCSVVTSAILVV